MNHKKIVLLFLPFFLATSCKEEFDPNSEFVPFDIIYGSINGDVETNKILVFSAFDASQFDSRGIVNSEESIYHEDSVSLELIEFDEENNERNSIFLEKVSDDNLESPIFNFTTNSYYQFNTSDFGIKEDHNYQLKFKNYKTEKVTYSNIRTIDDFYFKKPKIENIEINFVRDKKFLDYFIEIESFSNSEFISNASVNFHIEERTTIQYGNHLIKKYDLQFPIVNHQIRNKTKLPAQEKYKVDASSMFRFLIQSLPPIMEKRWRKLVNINFEVGVYSNDLKEYLDAENNFSSLSQTKPFYTNIYDLNTKEPQRGVFYSYKKENIPFRLQDTTYNFLDTSSVYKVLGF